MTADATKAPPRSIAKRRTLGEQAVLKRKAAEELDLIRWEVDEVIEKGLLPYKSARVLKEKCYRREVYHHNDGGRITFSPESIRLENARTLVAPIAA